MTVVQRTSLQITAPHSLGLNTKHGQILLRKFVSVLGKGSVVFSGHSDILHHPWTDSVDTSKDSWLGPTSPLLLFTLSYIKQISKYNCFICNCWEIPYATSKPLCVAAMVLSVSPPSLLILVFIINKMTLLSINWFL